MLYIEVKDAPVNIIDRSIIGKSFLVLQYRRSVFYLYRFVRAE